MCDDRRIYGKEDFKIMLDSLNKYSRSKHPKIYYDFLKKTTEFCLIITGLTEIFNDLEFDGSYLEKYNVPLLEFDIDAFVDELEVHATSAKSKQLTEIFKEKFHELDQFYNHLKPEFFTENESNYIREKMEMTYKLIYGLAIYYATGLKNKMF